MTVISIAQYPVRRELISVLLPLLNVYELRLRANPRARLRPRSLPRLRPRPRPRIVYPVFCANPDGSR